MMRAALIAAALLAACSPPASDTPGSITAEWKDPFDTGPVVQLPYRGDGVRIDVAVGQVMIYEAQLNTSLGDALRPVNLPPFIEYVGRSSPPSDEPLDERRRVGGSVDTYLFTFVAREPGEGELVLQSYSARDRDYPVDVVFRATIAARAP